MSLFDWASTLSISFLVLSVAGKGLAILCALYRRKLFSAYISLRQSYKAHKDTGKRLHVMAIRAGSIIFGTLLLLLGIVLVPLPGPGTLVFLAGIILLDLQFDWLVPSLDWLLNRLPEPIKPRNLMDRLRNLRETT